MEKPIIPYYEDHTRINNSSLGAFIKSGPKNFKKVFDGEAEKLKGSQLEKGTMIHMYLLQPDEFWNNYQIADFKVPSTDKQKQFCIDYINSLELIDDAKLLEAYKKNYTLRVSEDTNRKNAQELMLSLKEYIDYLKDGGTKTLITGADYAMLEKIKTNIYNHKLAKELMLDDPGMECHNEFHINWDWHDKDLDYNLNCKSLLDRIKIDHANKKIILIDLKTTSDIWNFKHSVEVFDYYRQMTFYLLAITWYMLDSRYNIDDYDLDIYIIAIDTLDYTIRVFNLNDENELKNKQDLILNCFKELAYHFKNNVWDYTYKYYNGNGAEEL